MNEALDDSIGNQHGNNTNEPIDPKRLLAFGSKQIIRLINLCDFRFQIKI